MPKRIQRRRTKGSKLVSPSGRQIVYVGRPGRWGNPFDMRYWILNGYSREAAAEIVVNNFRRCMGRDEPFDPEKVAAMAWIRDHVDELRGKDLACWCREDDPYCHADVLLEISNA